MHMQIPLSILASLLPLALSAPTPDPFAFAPKSSLNSDVNANAQVEALRDAAIFSRSSEYIKVRRQVSANFNAHAHAHARGMSGHKKKRACAAKNGSGNTPAQQPVYAAQPPSSASPTTDAYEAASTGYSYSAEATSASATAAITYSAESAAPSDAAAEDTSASNESTGNAFFPVNVKERWTTAESESGAISYDAAFKPLAAGKLPPSTAAPDGSYGLYSDFPAGTYKITPSSGFNFYSPGPSSVPVTSASEVTLSYSVYFSEGFDFVKGGKLPGLYGGASEAEAKSCSGGRQDNRGRCFSARLMWRKEGMGEFYNYYPTGVQQGGGYCETAPMSHCDDTFGDSIGRGSFTFPSGKWTTVTQRLKLNSPASASNGEQELWVDGRQVMNLSGLRIRTTDETKIYGVMAQTFFGGGDDSWASTRDQGAWFKDWSLGIVA